MKKSFLTISALLFSFLTLVVSAQQRTPSKSKAKINLCSQSDVGGGISGSTSYPTGLAADSEFSESSTIESPKTFPSGTKPLLIRSKPIAKYREKARENCVEGTVVLRVTFLANGKIGRIKVLKGLGYGLSEKAVEAAKLIKFEPEITKNKPVTVTKELKYSFNIY